MKKYHCTFQFTKFILLVVVLLFLVPFTGKTTHFEPRGFIITEAYYIDETQNVYDFMNSVLDKIPWLYYSTRENTDSITILVLNHNKAILGGNGTKVQNKEDYARYFEYYDKNDNLVPTDFKNIDIFEVEAKSIFFDDEGFIKILFIKERLENSIEVRGVQFYFFSFHINDVTLQLYAYEVDI